MTDLPDIQKTKDHRGIFIDRVGVEGIDFPLLISKKDKQKFLVYATVDLFTSLHKAVRGTNMSRFVEILMDWRYKVFTISAFESFLQDLRSRMGGEEVKDVYAKMSFKLFLPKSSPVTERLSVMSYKCAYIGVLRSNRTQVQLQVVVPTTSNCPCSKEISDYGAHGQRSISVVTVQPLKEVRRVWFEDLILLVESCGSAPIYPLLKRPDEKYVTELAYNNPKFVEDIARDIAKKLQELGTLRSFKIKVCNEESIHTHNAVCYIARRLRGSRWENDPRAFKTS